MAPPHKGQITFGGGGLVGLPTHKVIARGLACIPEGRQMFPKLTVEENLRLGAYQVSDDSVVRHRLAEVYDTFPRLAERRDQLTGTMSAESRRWSP